jgi:hypothetical protein
MRWDRNWISGFGGPGIPGFSTGRIFVGLCGLSITQGVDLAPIAQAFAALPGINAYGAV